MTGKDNIENKLEQLSESITPDQNFVKKVMTQIESKPSPTTQPASMPEIWRITMKTKKTKFAAAAVILIAVLSGINFWPSSLENGKWWLGPPAAWGQEIIESLQKVEALVYRKQGVLVGRFGGTHVSGTWSRNYEAADRFRKDTYYEHTDEDTYGNSKADSVLQNTTWHLPDGEDLIKHEVSFEFQCYTIKRTENGAYENDPVERLRFYVNLVDKADRILDTKIFNDQECIGFEIRASKYGNNPKEWIDRIWFDVQTKLPVRIEYHGRPLTNLPGQTHTSIQDQFEYFTEIPADMFSPEIPEDFINAEPGEIRAAREEEEKGEMVFADVPKELRDELVAALRNVKTAIYSQHSGGQTIYMSEYDWRKDSYFGEQILRKTEWFVVDQNDWGKTSLDFNAENFTLTQTIVIFTNHRYKIITHGHRSHPDNPMNRIIFLASWIDKADHILENRVIEGIECFGFELSAKKYGTSPDTSKHRLWFDIETKLPVRMEFEWQDEKSGKKHISTKEHFQWNPELDEETFVPVIPEGFQLIEAGEK